ncbi:MAG: sulfurtransferase complex subunit TusB [Pseudomonadales bacterium]|nr:sulfurtransferase complex subunit TusB [Pseudomonadales bacterium]
MNKSPFAGSALDNCLAFLAGGDEIVLLEDGVVAATLDIIDRCEAPIYAIEADVKARGLSARLRSTVKLIGYDEFVNLCTMHNSIRSWS